MDIVSPIAADTVGSPVVLICLLETSIIGSCIAVDMRERTISFIDNERLYP